MQSVGFRPQALFVAVCRDRTLAGERDTANVVPFPRGRLNPGGIHPLPSEVLMLALPAARIAPPDQATREARATEPALPRHLPSADGAAGHHHRNAEGKTHPAPCEPGGFQEAAAMVIVMKHQASAEEIGRVVAHIEEMGFRAHLSSGEERTIIGVIGDERGLEPENFEMLEGVERAMRVLHPFKLASRDFHPEDSVVRINGSAVGGKTLALIAGPCSIESREQLMEAAQAVKEAGAKMLRAGAFKPRTS